MASCLLAAVEPGTRFAISGVIATPRWRRLGIMQTTSLQTNQNKSNRNVIKTTVFGFASKQV